MSGVQQEHVELVGDHPHAGRCGTIDVVNGKVQVAYLPGVTEWMVHVQFPDGTACFAGKGQLRPVDAESRR